MHSCQKLGLCKQEEARSHEDTSKALAEAQHKEQQCQHAQQELSNLKLEHESLQREMAVTNGRVSAFDESCQRSLERVETLAAALQQAQQAKVSTSSSSLVRTVDSANHCDTHDDDHDYAFQHKC